MFGPIIITCALVGAELTRDQTPYLPLSPDEIAASAIAAHQAGAAMVHLHVRDESGRPTCRQDIFQEVVQKIRAKCDVIIQVSTGGAIGDSFETRMEPLAAEPDMASLTTGSINFGDEVFLNPRPFIEQLAAAMAAKGIKPEVEVFDTAMLETALQMVGQGSLGAPLHIDLVLGVPGGLAPSESNLEILVSRIPQEFTWSVAAMGRHQFPMAQLAIKKGGHVRVGLEDNIYLSKGVLARSNAELVERAVQLAKAANRNIASSAQAREILKISSTLPD